MARILVVEDEAMISTMLEGWLVEIGYQPVGPAGSIDDALKMIAEMEIDAAILDVYLRGERSSGVADALADKNIPFVFATGDTASGIPERHSTRPVVRKPFDFAILSAVVRKLAGPTA